MVIHSRSVSVLSQILGWIYFLLWSLSFYPQAWENWRRKRSVCLPICLGPTLLTWYLSLVGGEPPCLSKQLLSDLLSMSV